MENNEITRQEKNEVIIQDNKEITSDIMLEEIIYKAIQIPGVKVDRNKFLAEIFSSKVDLLENIINNGPIGGGITREEINNIANRLIMKRTSQSSIASFAAGIPGGLAMAATIPADILQFFGMSLRLAQELSYLYGADDLWENGKVDDEKVKNQLILYCGVMFGVSGAVSGVSKAIPVIGGVISGTINFASMMPMARKLNATLDNATFDYSEEEFNRDIELLSNETGKVSEEDKQSFKEKFVVGFSKTKNSVSNLFSKLGNNKDKSEINPIEEIKKYKELLDSGIINQEEFNKKKKDLLNL